MPAWNTFPAGKTWSMISLRPPYAPMGSPPPMILPSVVKSGVDAGEDRLRAAIGHAEACDHLVEDQQ